VTVAYAGLPIKAQTTSGRAVTMTRATAPIRWALILLLALGVAACGGRDRGDLSRAETEKVDKQAKDPNELDPGKARPGISVKVAMLLPLTGRYAKVGKSMQRAAQMAVLETRSKNLNVLTFDTAGTPEGAVIAVEKAIAAGAKLIIGPLFKEAVAAVKEKAAESDLNVVAFSNSESVAGDNVFLLSFLLRQQVDRIVQYAAKNGVKEIGVLVPGSVTGERIATYAKAAASRYGATITRVGYYSGGMPKMTTQIKAFAAGRPFKGVLIHAGGSRLRTLVSFLAFNDVLQPRFRYLGTSRWEHPSIRTEANLRGGWFAAPDPEARERFIARYERIFKERPVRLASLAYDAIALAATLAKKAKDDETNPYSRDAITDPSGFLGSDGLFRFTEDGLTERGLAVLEVTPDEFRVIGSPRSTFVTPTN